MELKRKLLVMVLVLLMTAAILHAYSAPSSDSVDSTLKGNYQADSPGKIILQFGDGETIVVDNWPPNISFNPSTTSNRYRNSDYIFINVTAKDNNSIKEVTEDFNGTNSSLTNNKGDFWWENHTGLAEGTYTYRAWVEDDGGNFDSTELRNATIDQSPPTTSDDWPRFGTWQRFSTVDIGITAKDKFSPVDRIEYSVNNSGVSSVSPNTTVNIQGNGNRTITYNATDKSGNTASNIIKPIPLDAEISKITSVTDDAGTRVKTGARINITTNWTEKYSGADEILINDNSSGTFNKSARKNITKVFAGNSGPAGITIVNKSLVLILHSLNKVSYFNFDGTYKGRTETLSDSAVGLTEGLLTISMGSNNSFFAGSDEQNIYGCDVDTAECNLEADISSEFSNNVEALFKDSEYRWQVVNGITAYEYYHNWSYTGSSTVIDPNGIEPDNYVGAAEGKRGNYWVIDTNTDDETSDGKPLLKEFDKSWNPVDNETFLQGQQGLTIDGNNSKWSTNDTDGSNAYITKKKFRFNNLKSVSGTGDFSKEITWENDSVGNKTFHYRIFVKDQAGNLNISQSNKITSINSSIKVELAPANTSQVQFLPNSSTSTNVSAENQTDIVGIWNVTNTGGVNVNVTFNWNETLPAGIDTVIKNGSNPAGAINTTNESKTILTEITPGSEHRIWAWAHFYSPTPGQKGPLEWIFEVE